MNGWAAASSVRAVASTGSVEAVARYIVRDRVARVKSSKRNRSTTVRPARPARRVRRVTRSTSAASTGSSSPGGVPGQPSARCEPSDRRPRPLRTGPHDAVVRDGIQMAPRGPADRRHERRLAGAGQVGDRVQPGAVQLLRGRRADAPQLADRQRVQERDLGAGLDDEQPVRLGHAALASFATTFVDATPTLIGSPTCDCTVLRSVRAICSAEPAIRSMPVTSRNASSIEMHSTTGDVRSKIARTARLAST